MSWIIRLQNLPWSANSMDVRMFFAGLSIPDGGVHIVGGELGDAFIAFSTDEDARQAMTMDGCKLKEIGVRLLLSSRSEMQKVIETARQQSVSVFQLNGAAPTPVVPVAPQVQIPPPMLQSQQLLLAQQLLQQQAQQQQHLPFNSTVTAIPGLGGITKMDFPAQTMPALINDRHRTSNDKRLSAGGGVPRDRRRDSRSRSRDRDRRVRSTSRDRSRRNRSRSRSPDRRYRRRRDKRSYSRDEYDSDDSDSRSSGGRKRTSPPKANVQVWDSQVVNSFRAAVYNNGGAPNADNGGSVRGHNTANGLQQLRERRNEADQKRPEESTTADNAIDLTEDDHNCCVKVSNIERTTGYGELRRFFQGLPVRQNGLKMINDNQGKRTGVAYVRFHRPESRKFAIMRSGQVLNGSKLTVATLDDNEFEEAVDSYRPPISGHTTSPQNRMAAVNGNGGGSGNQLKISGGTAATPQPLAFDQIVFTCLKITDVPSLTTEQDIMRVFSEYGLMHIIITKDKQKRNCAFIKLNRAEDAKRVLREKNSYTMAHKLVTVTMCSEAVFEEVMNSTAIAEAPVVVEDDMERTQSPADGATKPKTDKQKGGSRWGEKVESPPMQLPINPPVTIPAALLPHNSPDNGPKKLPSRWSCEEMRPMHTQMDPILSQLNLALPFLSTLLPQAAAAVKNVEQQQQQYHNLLQQPQQQPEMAPVSRDPRLKNITSSHANIPRGVANDPRNNNPRFSAGPRRAETDCVVVSNLEPSCSDLDVAAFFSKAGIVPLRVHILLSTTGGPSGDAFVEFSNPKEANAALLQNERLLGKNPVFVETIPREQVDEVLASFGRGGGGGGRGGQTTPTIIPQAPASIYNQFAATGINPGLLQGANPRAPMQGAPFAPGIMNPGLRPGGGPQATHVLALNNVPYRAGVDDILEFFDGFDIRPQDVMRRFNDQGQPTAEAKVRFKNPAEARKAFEQSKSGKILGRTIFLEFDP